MPPGMGSESSEIQIDGFHDLILTNDTEVFEQIYQSQHVDELDRINHWKDEASIKSASETKALSATPHSIHGLVASYYWGWMGFFHDAWLNVCAGVVTLYIISIVVPLFLPMGIVRPIEQIGMRAGRHWAKIRARVPARTEKIPRIRAISNPPMVRFRRHLDSVGTDSIELQSPPSLNLNAPGRSSLSRRWVGLFDLRSSRSPAIEANEGEPE